MSVLNSSPYLMYSDGKGNIFEDTSLYNRPHWLGCFAVPVEDWIELPDGGHLYELPGRRGIGIDVKTGEMRLCEKGWAVAAFIPPAHTGLYLAAYETAPMHLRFHCFVIRQLAGTMINFMFRPYASKKISGRNAVVLIQNKLRPGVDTFLQTYPHNRLVKHLIIIAALPIIVRQQEIILWAGGNARFHLRLHAMPIASAVFLFSPRKKRSFQHRTGLPLNPRQKKLLNLPFLILKQPLILLSVLDRVVKANRC